MSKMQPSSPQYAIPKPDSTRQGKGAKKQHIGWLQHALVYLNSHFLAFTISFRNLSLTPLASFMTMAAIGVCLSLPVGLYLFIKNIQQISSGFDQGSAISLYIDAKSTPSQIDALMLKVKQYPFVEKTTYLSPENALLEFQQTSGLKDALSLLPENPLPGVISIEINSKKTTRTELIAMKENLAKLPQVKQAAFDYEWVEKLNGFISFGKILINCLYLIIGLGVILMVGNTVRLALECHKDEI